MIQCVEELHKNQILETPLSSMNIQQEFIKDLLNNLADNNHHDIEQKIPKR